MVQLLWEVVVSEVENWTIFTIPECLDEEPLGLELAVGWLQVDEGKEVGAHVDKEGLVELPGRCVGPFEVGEVGDGDVAEEGHPRADDAHGVS